jgi:hypothetical protein
MQRQTLILNHKKGVLKRAPFRYFFFFIPLDMARLNTIPIPIPMAILSRASQIATPITIPIANPLFERLYVFFFFKLATIFIHRSILADTSFVKRQLID